MQDDSSLPWPEYLRAWLDTLRYHPEQHGFRSSPADEAASDKPKREDTAPAQRERPG